MNAKITNGTSTRADSSVRSKTTRRKRPSKAALLRVKVVTVVSAMVLFLASLTSIAIFNPQVGKATALAAQPAQITIVEPSGSNSLVLAPPPRVAAVRPLVRTRGS